MGIAAAGVQVEYSRFMGVAAQSDHRVGDQIYQELGKSGPQVPRY